MNHETRKTIEEWLPYLVIGGTPFVILFSLTSAGFHGGTIVPMLVFFPTLMWAGRMFPILGDLPFWVLPVSMFLQYLVYAWIVQKGLRQDRFWLYSGILLALHGLSVLVVVLYYINDL